MVKGIFRRVPFLVSAYQNTSNEPIELATEHGIVLARPTDWIIEGVLGELYPCSDRVFKKIYERELGT